MSQGKRIDHVKLPSGRRVEVSYYDGAPAPTPTGKKLVRASSTALHLCSECHSDLVYPDSAHPAGAGQWIVTLVCPNCFTSRTGVYEDTLVDELDCRVDQGYESLVDGLEWLTRLNMTEDVERFVDALQQDCVLPEDF